MKIIVTDLTRFQKPDVICLAGIDIQTDECVRPMMPGARPYIALEDCKQLNVLPGAILEGDLVRSKRLSPPHTEDHSYSKLKFLGPCSGPDFEKVLDKTSAASVNDGFDRKVPNGEKVVPHDDPPSRSIVTIRLLPQRLRIVRDSYDARKLKAHVTDNDGARYAFLPITDLGFHNVAVAHQADSSYVDQLNDFIARQAKVYLRIGLSRQYSAPDGRVGFWIQVNGIYTFPNFLTEVRTHQSGKW